MGVYKMCIKCGNQKKGDYIKKCRKCGEICCSSCNREGPLGGFVKCPKCKAPEFELKMIGKIE